MRRTDVTSAGEGYRIFSRRSRDMRWLTPNKSRYKCLIWIMYDRNTNSSRRPGQPHNCRRQKLWRFIASDIITKFAIILEAINRVIKSMCAPQCVGWQMWLPLTKFYRRNWVEKNLSKKIKTLKRQHSHKNKTYVSNFWSAKLWCERNVHKICY